MFLLMPSAVSFPYSVIFIGGMHKGSILWTRECNLQGGDQPLHFGDHWRRYHFLLQHLLPSPMLYYIWVAATTLQLKHFSVLCILANPLEDCCNNVLWGWDLAPPYFFEHILLYHLIYISLQSFSLIECAVIELMGYVAVYFICFMYIFPWGWFKLTLRGIFLKEFVLYLLLQIMYQICTLLSLHEALFHCCYISKF